MEIERYYLARPCKKVLPVQKNHTLNDSQLVELLNKEMTRYNTLACDRSFKKELVDCKERIKELQKEIYKRKNKFAI